MTSAPTATEDLLSETVSLLTQWSNLLAEAISDLDAVLEREAASEIGPAEALATMRAMMDRHYAEDATAH